MDKLFQEHKLKSHSQNSLYTVAAEEDNQVVGMGRLIGDGMYYMIVDIVVQPAYQQMGIGSKILNMIIEYVDSATPDGGRCSIQLIAEKRKRNIL